MLNIEQKKQDLIQLEKKLEDLPMFNAFNGKWINTFRKTLGITLKQLGERLGLNKSNIFHYEKSEAEGVITIKSLKKVANEFDCELVYYFKPRVSLEASQQKISQKEQFNKRI
jgi:predicted DNA-binding mobile mystery protein A